MSIFLIRYLLQEGRYRDVLVFIIEIIGHQTNDSTELVIFNFRCIIYTKKLNTIEANAHILVEAHPVFGHVARDTSLFVLQLNRIII